MLNGDGCFESMFSRSFSVENRGLMTLMTWTEKRANDGGRFTLTVKENGTRIVQHLRRNRDHAFMP